jgi:C4-dicarboxylate-specific signal transduction histidine kinase
MQTARTLQIFLVSMSAPLLLLAAVLEERARAARESREQREQLTHLSRVAMLSDMSGGLAHELNQPLTAILSNAQAAQHLLANKKVDDAELGDILNDIIAADERAGEVIRRLRSLFRRGETEFLRLDTHALVREVLTLANGDLVTRGVQTVLQLEPALPAVQGDRVQLQQVMLNLVMNAAEAMVPGPERVLRVRTFASGTEVQVSFVDTGPGFGADMSEKLFEPFYTTKRLGLGLGLSISRSIVTAHGGRLWGAPNPRLGASFHLILPAAGTRPPPTA